MTNGGVILSCDHCAAYAGLDGDMLVVLPAFSRHPSLKHLLLGKNFNVKGRWVAGLDAGF